jgi:hypothetical protein
MARAYLPPGGRFTAVDPVFEDGRPLIAQWLAKLDSGERVRTAPPYAALIASAFECCDGRATTFCKYRTLIASVRRRHFEDMLVH